MECYNRLSSNSCEGAQQVLRALGQVGEWLSLVEHLVRDQGVGGSNPLSPTNLFKYLSCTSGFSVYRDGVDFLDGACFSAFPLAFARALPERPRAQFTHFKQRMLPFAEHTSLAISVWSKEHVIIQLQFCGCRRMPVKPTVTGKGRTSGGRFLSFKMCSQKRCYFG